MKNIWKWILGILAAVLVIGLIAMPFIAHSFFPYNGYGMMGRGFGYNWGRMPMHGGYGYGSWPMMGGYGMMGGGFFFSGLIQFGLLVLIVLGIIWLVRALQRQNAPKENTNL